MASMEDPFYPGFWSSRPALPRAAPPTMAKPSRPAKVVSIPVHFMNSDDKEQRRSTATSAAAVASTPSERISTSAAALEIQRAFRGFVVRKNLRAVRRLESEVDAVEREVERVGDLLRRDARERLRVSESLMSILLRLDSVRGVRDYRRRVIRRAISIQEAVDALAAAEESSEGAAAPREDVVGERSEGNAPRKNLEAQEPMPMEIPRSTNSDPEALEGHAEAPSSRDEDGEEKVDEEDSAGEGVAKGFKQEEGEGAAAVTMEEALGVESGAMAMREASEDRREDQLGDVILKASMIQDDEGSGQEKTGKSSAPALVMVEGEASKGCGDNMMRQAMERLVEESKGLKGLVAELCERNEMQLRLMDGLLQRVERLEKVVEKMGRKKKKHAADAKKCCARKCDRKGCGL